MARRQEERRRRQVPPPNPGAGGGRMHYRDDELNDLMDIMELVLPNGKYEKEKVAERYNEIHSDRPREYQNLMTQFNKFASKKPPTGYPECPPLVRRAKQIVEKIKKKAGIACFTEEDDDVVPMEAGTKNAVVGTTRTTGNGEDEAAGGKKNKVVAWSTTKKAREGRNIKDYHGDVHGKLNGCF
jgi:hypothetical protein